MNATDYTLMRRFEPIIRYTRGERFFPMDVETYVNACSLWLHRPDQFPLRLYNEEELTIEKLGESRLFPIGSVPYMKFIDPLNMRDLAAMRAAAWLERKKEEDQFHAGHGRLARVGYVSRLVDALFSLSLLARGRVPGDTAVAAIQAYQDLMAEREMYTYYGRVLRQNSWICLQY